MSANAGVRKHTVVDENERVINGLLLREQELRVTLRENMIEFEKSIVNWIVVIVVLFEKAGCK